jgi:hypothetical protein
MMDGAITAVREPAGGVGVGDGGEGGPGGGAEVVVGARFGAAEIRNLLEHGTFTGARVPLSNGGTLPAELFAKVALDDLDYQTGLDRGRHEVALAREYANAQQIRFPA